MAPAIRPRITSTTMISISVMPRTALRRLARHRTNILFTSEDMTLLTVPAACSVRKGPRRRPACALLLRHEGIELHDRHQDGEHDERHPAAHGHDHHRLEQRGERPD